MCSGGGSESRLAQGSHVADRHDDHTTRHEQVPIDADPLEHGQRSTVEGVGEIVDHLVFLPVFGEVEDHGRQRDELVRLGDARPPVSAAEEQQGERHAHEDGEHDIPLDQRRLVDGASLHTHGREGVTRVVLGVELLEVEDLHGRRGHLVDPRLCVPQVFACEEHGHEGDQDHQYQRKGFLHCQIQAGEVETAARIFPFLQLFVNQKILVDSTAFSIYNKINS